MGNDRTGSGARIGVGEGRGDAERSGHEVAVGVVGFGRAGRAMATALANGGRRVAVYSASAAGRAHARAILSGLSGLAVSGLVAEDRADVPDTQPADTQPADVAGGLPEILIADRLDALVEQCDVVVCAVPDGAIGGVADELVAGGQLGARHVVVHLSGRHGLGVLDAVRVVGAARAAVHPVMTIPGRDDDARLLAGTPFGVTVDPAAADVVAWLVGAVGGLVVPVADEARTTYHAGLVLGANFLCTLVNSAVDVLAAAGVADGASLAGPLLRASLDNALRSGEAAWTGPVRRADSETLAAHLRALGEAAPWVVDAYVTLATLTASRLRQAGLMDREQADAVYGAVYSGLRHQGSRIGQRRGDEDGGSGRGGGIGGTEPWAVRGGQDGCAG